MPFYRVGGTVMHLKLTGRKDKHPKACPCELGPGLGRCLAIATILCDYPVDGHTCDMPICEDHATEVGLDRHHCPRHAKSEPPQSELF